MEANEAMKAMAKRIAWETVLRVEGTTRENMAAAALAAIMETQSGLPDQERILDIMDEHLEAEYVGTYIAGRREAAAALAAALSAAIGEDIGGGRG